MVGRRIILSSALLLLLLFSGAVSRADEPARGRVGAITLAEGEVAIWLPASGRAGGDLRSGAWPSGAWSEAGRNDPVASGMSLRTGTAARAVLRFGPDLLAVADGSEADIVRLDDAGTTIALRRGRLGVRLSEHDSGRDVEITLPIGTLRLSAPGEYDIVAGDGKSPARVAVPAGTARFSGQRLDTVAASGGAVLLSGGDPVTILPGSTQGRRIRRMVAGAEARFGRCAGASPCLGRGHRPRDARRAWRLGKHRRSRRGVVSEGPAARLGAIPIRALALDRPVGMDLDRRYAMGFRDLAFRPLGQYRRVRCRGRALGVGPGRAPQSARGSAQGSTPKNRPLCPPRLPFSAPPGSGSAIPTRSAPRWPGFHWRRARFIGRVSPTIRRRSGASTPAAASIRRRSAQRRSAQRRSAQPGRTCRPPISLPASTAIAALPASCRARSLSAASRSPMR